MIFSMTYYQICWYFLFYSFCGWFLEVIFHAAALGKIVNRGFLNGPVCPVYGFGSLAVFSLTGYLQQSELYLNDFWLFVSGVLLATLVELIAGWLMDKCFHARWWDYSDKPLNFHGYICLEFSLIWGVCVLLAVRLLQAYVANRNIVHDPSVYGWVILAICYFTLAADLLVTILVLRGFNRTLTKLNAIQESMKLVSNQLSETVGSQAISAARLTGEAKVQAALGKAELKDKLNQKLSGQLSQDEACKKLSALQARFDELSVKISGNNLWGQGRFLYAFPSLKHRDHPDIIRILRERKEGK